MDIVDKVVVGIAVVFVAYLIYQLGLEYHAELQDKIDAEIDRLHK